MEKLEPDPHKFERYLLFQPCLLEDRSTQSQKQSRNWWTMEYVYVCYTDHGFQAKEQLDVWILLYHLQHRVLGEWNHAVFHLKKIASPSQDLQLILLLRCPQ